MLQSHRQDVSAETIAHLTSQIDTQGFAVIPDYIDPERLRYAQEFVKAEVAKNGGNYLAINGSDNLGGTFLQVLPKEPGFVQVCQSIYAQSTGRQPPDTPFYQVLRCLSGNLAKANSLNFHYDSYVLTALIPIIVPEFGIPGDLLIIPNSRAIRSTYVRNLLDKVLLDNPLTQKLLTWLYTAKSKKIKHIALNPGSLYFFYGYRSIHTNEACSPNAIRSTALFHYADPHAQSRLKNVLRR